MDRGPPCLFLECGHKAHSIACFEESIQPARNPRQYLLGILRYVNSPRRKADPFQPFGDFTSGQIAMVISIGIEVLHRFEVVAAKNFSTEQQPVESMHVVNDTGPVIDHHHAGPISLKYPTDFR